MQLTRTPCGPSSCASVRVRPRIAHLAAAYGARRGNPNRPAVDDRLTIDPEPCRRRCGAANREHRNTLSRLTARHRRQSPNAMSSTSAVGPATPALLTRMSSPPSTAMACSNNAPTCASSETSQTMPDRPGCACSVLASSPASTSQMHTLAPACRNAVAVARPMPLAAAVTSTRCPLWVCAAGCGDPALVEMVDTGSSPVGRTVVRPAARRRRRRDILMTASDPRPRG